MGTATRQPQSIAEVLREAFEASPLTQVQLASKLGREQQTISNWLRGERNITASDFAAFMQACEAPGQLYLALQTIADGVTRSFPFLLSDLHVQAAAA